MLEKLLSIPGVSIRMERDRLGWTKVRVQWDAFPIIDAAFADGQLDTVLEWAMNQIQHVREHNQTNDR